MNADDKEINELISQHRQMFKQCKDEFSRAKEQQYDYLKNRAGILVDGMIRDRLEAQLCLRHSNGAVRLAALSILMSKWNAETDSAFRQICEEMAFSDPDLGAREVALTELGSCYENTHDRRLQKKFVEVVYDASLPAKVRLAAYSSIYALFGERDLNLDFFSSFEFPHDVDWDWLASVR